MKFVLHSLIICFLPSLFIAQVDKICVKEIQEVIKADEARKDSVKQGKVLHLKYNVRVTDWEDETTLSNVNLYKNETHLHFFSEQANVYQDLTEAVVILPQQKIAFLSDMDKSLANFKMSDAFFQLRKGFLDSCQILQCGTKLGSVKTLVLKPRLEEDGALKITKLSYEYDLATKTVLQIKVEYNDEYKLKQMVITYKEFKVLDTYPFAKCTSYLLDKKGQVLAKYKDYELEDNRNPKK